MSSKHDRELKRLEYHIDLVLLHPYNPISDYLSIHHHLWGPPKQESYHKKKRKELQQHEKCPFSSSLQFCLVPSLSLTHTAHENSLLDFPF
jgi:hypothetical protein